MFAWVTLTLYAIACLGFLTEQPNFADRSFFYWMSKQYMAVVGFWYCMCEVGPNWIEEKIGDRRHNGGGEDDRVR